MPSIVAQCIGSLAVAGVFALVAVFGPKIMYSQSWRDEQLDYENQRMIESTTLGLLQANADKMDRIFSLTNVTLTEMEYIVKQYSDGALPNATMLAAPGPTFKPRWSESNARGALLENVLLEDNNILIYTTPTSLYISSLFAIAGMIPATMICASMVAVYQKILMNLLFHCTGMSQCESIESVYYMRAMVLREVMVLGASILFAMLCLAQAAVTGWLESGKTWSFASLTYWASLTFTGIAHSPTKPSYMDFPQMTTWLSLCHFCMILHMSSSLGLVVISALRCYKARDSLKTLRLTDDEIRRAMAVDHKRVKNNEVDRPLYHN